jgi:secreted PhoX family phosphatase
LQALQVISRRRGTPIGFQPIDTAHRTGGIFTDDQKDISGYGPAFRTRWVTVHDTHVDTSRKPFDANAAAKAAVATPFKRPENGVFRPGSRFDEFFFTVTGDTNTTSAANTQFGGWGGLYVLRQNRPDADAGRLSLLYAGDQAHTGLDNIQFAGRDQLLAVEDASDTVHTQRGAFDSGYLFDVTARQGTPPVRFLAEGRDAAATQDSMLSAAGNGFQNDGDNEITGLHVSDGDPTADGILGAKIPAPGRDGWRAFWTQQHGDNVTWEILGRS